MKLTYISYEADIFSYQEDIIIGSHSFNEIVSKLSKLFYVLQKNNITLLTAKCHFRTTTM